MANIEKQQKQPMEQIVDAGSSADPTCPRTSHLIGRYMTNQQSDGRVHSSGRDDRRPADHPSARKTSRLRLAIWSESANAFGC